MTSEEHRRRRSALCAPPAEEAVVVVGDIEEEEEEDSSEDLEFSFSVRKPDELIPTVTADELFSGGRILPLYPVFDRDLIPYRFQNPAEEGAEHDLHIHLGQLSIDDGIARTQAAQGEKEAAGKCCESAPAGLAPQSPGRCKKSASTGRTRRWRLWDLMGRSRSDGYAKFSFFETEARGQPSTLSSPAETKEKVIGAGDRGAQQAKRAAASGQRAREIDTATANRTYYGGKGGSKQGMARRSFLPYRREPVGLFAPVNGLTSW